jgi:hypothetical protein
MTGCIQYLVCVVGGQVDWEFRVVCFGGRAILGRNVCLASLWTSRDLWFCADRVEIVSSVHSRLFGMICADAGDYAVLSLRI